MTTKSSTELRKISASEFARRLKAGARDQDRHFVFWLGAGCSVSSGIPASSSLVRDVWLPRLHALRGSIESIDAWAAREFPDYQPDKAGLLYGSVMNELFPVADERQRETQRLCEDRMPGFGYAVLATLMSRSDGLFSASLTTNFDDLIADAMYVFGSRRPLVIQHEALAGFARPGRVQRPLVVKVHGDHRLNPMHTLEETAELKADIGEGIRGLLQDRGVIFVGYAGNDHGVIEALEDLPADALPLGTWWVSRREPNNAIRKWLAVRDATWVETGSFDEFMLLLREEFEIAHPTPERFEQMFDRYRETYAELNVSVNKLAQSSPDSESLKEAARSASTQAPEAWWRLLLTASLVEQTDPDTADRIYREGIEDTNDSRLLTSYAVFLTNIRKDDDQAQELYERAIDTDPNEGNNLCNYAIFLTNIRKDDDQAQELFERAIEIDPNNANNLSNYAVFLKKTRKDYDQAQELFERAIEIDPNNANNLSNCAVFLTDIRKDDDRAQELFERAIEIDPNNANNLGNYAVFLTNVRKDDDRAQELYERAIDTDPNNANVLGNYAVFLTNVRKDDDRAQELYERAIDTDPNNANVLGSYAIFLKKTHTDDDQAQELYERAIEIDPNNANNLSNYAVFLTDIHKDDDQAQELFERAIEIDPNNANTLGNYSRLLFEKGHDEQAFGLVTQAFADATESKDDQLRAELWFYTLALGPTARAPEALSELAALVRREVRSPGWDFGRILDRARVEDRPYIDWLEKLADVISLGVTPDVLKPWDRWPSL